MGESLILGGIPIIMTSHSQKYVIISPENEIAGEFGIAPSQEEGGWPS